MKRQHLLKMGAILIVLLLGMGRNSHAQTTVQIGSGTGVTSSYFPNYYLYDYSYSQTIYLASELIAGGGSGPSYIDKIRFQPSASVSTINWKDWVVYLGNTAQNGFSGTANYIPVGSMTQVFSGTLPATTVANTWMEITLPVPFLWDGSSNLVVAVDENTSGWGNSPNWVGFNASPVSSSGNRGLYFYQDYTDVLPSSPSASSMGTTNSIAQIQFNLTPASACTTPPVAGTATVSNANPCAGSNIILSLSGNSVGSGQTYTWETSTSATGPWTPVSTASPSYFFTLAASNPGGTTYYRAEVTCSSVSTYSTPVAVTVPTLFPGGTYTVNPAGSGPNNFTTISAAINAFGCGIGGNIILDLAPGVTFNEQVTFPPTLGTSTTNTITVNGNGDTIKFNATSSAPWTLGLDGAKHISFNNLVIQGTNATYALVAHLWNGADSNTFQNCTFLAPGTGTGTLLVPFSVSGSPTSAMASGTSGSGITVDSCSLFGGYYSAVFYGNTAAANTGNRLTNSTIRDFYYYGSLNYYQNGMLLANNIVERPTRTQISTFYGIYLNTGCINSTIESNRVRNMHGGSPNYSGTIYAIYVGAAASAGNENKVFNNVVSNFNGNSTSAGIYLPGSYIQAYHNTVSVDNVNATAGTVYGIYATGSSSIDIKNNIVSITQGGTGTKYALYLSGAGKTSDYNNLYIGTSAGTRYIGYYSSGYTTLGAWQGANGSIWDQHSISVDPQFANAASGDFMPTSALLNNMGTPLSAVPTDILGAPRDPNTPDLGAYEFTVPPCIGTPFAGTAFGPLLACAGQPFVVGDTGATSGLGITYQWEESPSGLGMWTPISGATTPNFVVSAGITSPTDYRLVVTCTNGGASDVSNTLTIGLDAFVNCYCTPAPTSNTSGDNILNVTFAGINNTTTTGGVNGYVDYTSTVAPAQVMAGQSYPISMIISNGGTEYGGVWIDWDQNGIFDTSEYIYMGTGATPTVLSQTVNVPVTAVAGNTRMRVRSKYGSILTATEPCAGYSYGETEDYLVTVTPSTSCSGIPSAGVAYGADSVCPGQPFVLQDSLATLGLGIVYQWEESPSGLGMWTPIAGATSLFANISGTTSPTDYRLVVTCTNGGGSATSNVITPVLNTFVSCYCTPGPTTNTSSDDILNVTFAGINNTTTPAGVNGYVDYTTTVPAANVMAGASYPFTMTINNGGTEYGGVWFDWDQSGTFDSSEFISVGSGSLTPLTQTVNVPLTASGGTTRMRVRSRYSTPLTGADACIGYNYGETEDYLVTVALPIPCSGMPSAGVAFGPDSVCSGVGFMISDTALTLGTGISYQWQESPLGSGTWANLSGATSPSYSVSAGITASKNYRLVVHCSNSSLSDTSNVISVLLNAPVYCYCSPLNGTTLSTYPGNYITSVAIAGSSLNNSTPLSVGYTRFPPTANQTATLIPGMSYTLSVGMTYSGDMAGAWMDFNANGVFDASEMIALVSSGAAASGSFIVPLTATSGLTGLRVRVNDWPTSYAATEACYDDLWGETQDYALTIALPQPCSGVPVAGTASVNTDTTCSGTGVQLVLTGYSTGVSGIQIQWQSSPAGLNTFQNIAGATSDTIVVNVSSSTDYRAEVSCANSIGSSAYSNIVGTVIDNPAIAQLFPGGRCGAGPVTLAAMAVGGTTVRWYDSLTGGSLLATGNAFTTPPISATTDYYAAPVSGKLAPSQSLFTTTAAGNGAYGNLFDVVVTKEMRIDSFSIYATVPNTQVGIYYRVGTGTGSNTSNTGWTLLGTATIGSLTPPLSVIPLFVNLTLSPGTYSFALSTSATVNYSNGTAIGNVLATDGNLTIKEGYGGSSLYPSFGFTNSPRNFNGRIYYSLQGCEGPRVPVTATIHAAASGSGLSRGGTTLGANQGSGTVVSYMDACNDTVAVINSGTTNMGVTSAIVLTSSAVQTVGGQPYVPRGYDITPTTNGPATITLYALQSEFDAYNNYVTSNNLVLPLLPTGPMDAAGMSNIVVTQYHGSAGSGQGPLGLYDSSAATLIPNSAITVTPVGSHWKMTFAVTGFSGFFIHSGNGPLSIDLRSIAATNLGTRNQIQWMTGVEKAGDRFELERSIDGVFIKLADIASKGKPSSYTYIDEHPASGMNFYRVRMIDAAGAFSYSKTVQAFVKSGSFAVEAYPNPVSDHLTVNVYGGSDQGTLSLADITGKIVKVVTVVNGHAKVDMNGLAQGVYLLKYTDSEHSRVIKVNKQ